MVANASGFRDDLVGLVEEIAARVDRLAKDHESEIKERYGDWPTAEAVLPRLGEGAVDPLDALAMLRIWIEDVRLTDQPSPVAMLTIGEWWMYVATNMGMMDVPLTLKDQYRRELVSADRKRGWKRPREERDKMLKLFEERVKQMYARKRKLWHHDMVAHLLKQKEFAELEKLTRRDREGGRAQVSRRRLLNAAAKIAEEYGWKRGDKKT